MKLSVVIPSYKDPLLFKTIESILKSSKLGNEIEVIACLDGYWTHEIYPDERVKYIHLGKNVGMREAINTGVRVASGEYLMRTDEHCMYAEGFDKEILSSIKPNWIVTATRHYLDPKKWELMDIPPVNHEKLKIRNNYKFEGQRWVSRDKKQKDVPVSETMAMQGSFWIMPRKWWDDVIGELRTEGYGPLIQDSTEMVFKTWKAGGKLMLNKNTWYAHKHCSFPRTHQNGTIENPAKNDDGYQYAISVWGDYYNNEIKPKWGV